MLYYYYSVINNRYNFNTLMSLSLILGNNNTFLLNLY